MQQVHDRREVAISAANSDRNEIASAISLLFKPVDVVEVRILKTRAGTISGYFDDHEKLAETVQAADLRYRAGGVYWTINRVNPTLLARACNRLKEHAENTTADNHILRRHWLPVDLDPIRPAGISSSEEEHDAALARAYTIAIEMATEWGRPIIADSGNGAHLLYEVDLPNTEQSLRTVSAMLAMLDRRFSDEVVKVDLSSANAARIWKVYGTVARKGDNIPGRPHRISRILEVPRDTK
jgi:hypothetical protein